MGIIGMKIPARDRLFKPDGITSIKGPMTYVLTLPVSTVIIGCKTVKQLEENVEIARTFTPMPAAEMAKLGDDHQHASSPTPSGSARTPQAPARVWRTTRTRTDEWTLARALGLAPEPEP